MKGDFNPSSGGVRGEVVQDYAGVREGAEKQAGYGKDEEVKTFFSIRT
ncbi:MAG: hypothetical protein V2G48_07265 [bacterium JZ-2024 1]